MAQECRNCGDRESTHGSPICDECEAEMWNEQAPEANY